MVQLVLFKVCLILNLGIFSISLVLTHSYSFLFQGRRRRRPGLHLRGRLGQQSDPDLPPGRQLPAGVRFLGLRWRRIQGPRGRGHHVQREHLGVRPGEPSGAGVLGRCLGSVWPVFLVRFCRFWLTKWKFNFRWMQNFPLQKNIINYYIMGSEMENRDGILNRTEKFNACFIRNQFA